MNELMNTRMNEQQMIQIMNLLAGPLSDELID